MITKEEAVDVLEELENSGILDKSIEDKLNEICTCIGSLDDGLDLFGADDDYVDLFVAKADPYHSSAPYNTDELKKEYDEWVAHCEKIAEKYKIKAQ